MKNIYFFILVLFSSTAFNPYQLFGQKKNEVLYDDWPTTVKANADRKKQKPNGGPADFVLIGSQWNNRIVTYFFQNGTADIAGDTERNLVRQAMGIWTAQAGIAFMEVCNANAADIIILWAEGDHGDGAPFFGVNGVLAHAFGPPPSAFAGDLHFDDAETWVDQIRNDGGQPIDLVSVAAHELGHSLGLDHTTVAGSLMLPTYTGSQRFLGPDDIAGMRSLYGQANTLIRSPNIDLGSQPICGSVVLVVDGVPAGSTLTWNSSDSNGLSIASNGVATRQNNYNGDITVTATINNGCSNLVLSRTVSVGTGRTGGTYSYGYNTYDISGNVGIAVSSSANTIYFNLTNSSRPNTFSWSVTPSGSVSHNLGTSNSGSITLGGGASANVVCTINTPCGQTSISFSCYNYSRFRMAAYPNPANNELTVAAVKTDEDKDFDDQTLVSNTVIDEQQLSDTDVTVRLLNKDNKIVSEGKLKKGKIKFAVTNLADGIYFLHMSFGDKKVSRQIVIQH